MAFEPSAGDSIGNLMALATKDELKALLGVKHSEDDDLLDRLLESSSSYFEKQARRTIAAADYVETKDGRGGTAIVPSEYPIVSVTSLTINGETVDESPGYGSAGWYIKDDLVRLRDCVASEGEGNIVLEYRAGYEDVPDDVRQAVLEMAALMYREKDRVGQQSRTGPDGSTVFYYAPPARVVATIEAYKRVQ